LNHVTADERSRSHGIRESGGSPPRSAVVPVLDKRPLQWPSRHRAVSRSRLCGESKPQDQPFRITFSRITIAAPPQARPGRGRPPRGTPTVRRVLPPRARGMGLTSHPSSLRTIIIPNATRAGLVWRPGGDRMHPETNRAFAQSPPGMAASGHPLRVSLRGAPIGGRAPPGCREC
jgi:hypothetical protein